MANELKHGSVGTDLTQAEWEAIGAHVLDAQAIGDIIYASTTAQLRRLGIGGENAFLQTVGGIPAWISAPVLPGILYCNNQAFGDTYEAWRSFMAQHRFNAPPLTGWNETLVGTGATNQSNDLSSVRTGVTANSSALLRDGGINLMSAALTYEKFDWDDDFSIFFSIFRLNSDAEAVGRFQFKEVGTIGLLAELGVGIQVDNLALTGESYGTSRDTVNLVTSLTDSVGVDIEIRKTLGKVDFLVGNVSKGTITTAGKVPAGDGTGIVQIVMSVARGATGAVNSYLLRKPGVKIIQKR